MSHKQYHTFHLVNPSPWPFFGSFSVFSLAGGFTMYLHNYQGGGFISLLGLFLVIFTMFVWWRDIIREATFQGHHTLVVQRGLRIGVILFIVSEVMFFVAFFWAFFHSSLAPTVDIGSVWPPKGINPLDPMKIPLANTLLLLSSGITVTWCHHALVKGNKKFAIIFMLLTLFYAIFFTYLQYVEYTEASFQISDGIYGSTFYMATGFHGFHVIVGSLFLGVTLFRINKQLSSSHHFGFEAAAWYWHFVDVVWLFLFVTIYWWGSL